MEKQIAIIVGSLRKESFNRKIAHELMRLAPADLKLFIVEIGDLPFYNEDVEANAPQSWTDFRNKIKDSDGVIFVSPEYNRTLPGVLKNAIEVGSRPPKENAWKNKPGAVITVSPGAIGGFGANHHIRQAGVSVNIHMMPHPEAYIGNVKELLQEDGKTVIDKTAAFLTTFLAAFDKWVNASRV